MCEVAGCGVRKGRVQFHHWLDPDGWMPKWKWGPGNWTLTKVTSALIKHHPILWLHLHQLPYCLHLKGSGLAFEILISTEFFLTTWGTRFAVHHSTTHAHLSDLVSRRVITLPLAGHIFCCSPYLPFPGPSPCLQTRCVDIVGCGTWVFRQSFLWAKTNQQV